MIKCNVCGFEKPGETPEICPECGCVCVPVPVRRRERKVYESEVTEYGDS